MCRNAPRESPCRRCPALLENTLAAFTAPPLSAGKTTEVQFLELHGEEVSQLCTVSAVKATAAMAVRPSEVCLGGQMDIFTEQPPVVVLQTAPVAAERFLG